MTTTRLKFDPVYRSPIRNGRKYLTVRHPAHIGTIRKGMALECVDADTEEVFATGMIVETSHVPVREAWRLCNDSNGHKSYRNVDEMIGELQTYYPEEPIDDSTYVVVVAFDTHTGGHPASAA